MMNNFRPIASLSPFRRRFAYVDTPECLAVGLFAKHRVRIKAIHAWKRKDAPYRIILCSIWRWDVSKFLAAMEELPVKMVLCGHPDYQAYCDDLMCKAGYLLPDVDYKIIRGGSFMAQELHVIGTATLNLSRFRQFRADEREKAAKKEKCWPDALWKPYFYTHQDLNKYAHEGYQDHYFQGQTPDSAFDDRVEAACHYLETMGLPWELLFTDEVISTIG